MSVRSISLILTTAVAGGLVAGCSLLDRDAPAPLTVTSTVTTTATATPAPLPAVTVTAQPIDDDQYARPLWLGQVPLEMGDNNLGVPSDTPAELEDRQLAPREWLPDPPNEEWFQEISREVPDDVAVRSSWEAGCPVHIDDLAYVVMPYWGFDGEVHTGEMIVHEDNVDDVASAFEDIFAAQYPIEEMRVISREERDSPATGDHNVTSAFTCRQIVGAVTRWSQHAYGKAVDINPFHNPFRRDEELFPELSEAYLDREDMRTGMIDEASAVYAAFTDIGWSWGGHWTGREDWMHFSVNGH
ncbi:M15 family metallopeptidase [Demequina sp. NBRC 110055]|uniref:M15 family metallopeptidase n=1 Tax=Demequina sp. NBRC 110055 TaxID=1570344 RepID=UPI0013565D29|nr:M15 family metallopeptidase [Demequina sp. NBRC 110055]